uniref:F-box/FBD/LRR-repeat protein At1g13570-like n=1 Tax=Erigeron canadensis TaxID=72917 RepID=UPI001CB91C38|nr:F-box/FBD/LRR-repeat protein At1g13570-like [Erigeron canadensis]
MDVHDLNSDILSTIPQSIIESILMLMPIKDAVKTSILSRKWRYCWTTMPMLAFDDHMVKVEASNHGKGLKKYKLVNAILNVLFQHKGLELQFHYYGEMGFEFDQIILYLSNSKKLMKLFGPQNTSNNFYRLPSSFFSLQGLETLFLSNCNVVTPSTFNGFSKLEHLYLHHFEITSKSLRRLLSNCPLLKHISLSGGYKEDFAEENKFTFAELIECVPLIRTLDISQSHMKYLAMGGMPQELPTSLVYLKCLLLDVCQRNKDEISSTLSLMRNSPNLEVINFKIYEVLHDGHISINQLDFHDYSGFNLDHLKTFTLSCYTHSALQFEFVKLVLAKAPMLREAYIELDANVSIDKEARILRDMIRLPFARASSSAELIIARPDPNEC